MERNEVTLLLYKESDFPFRIGNLDQVRIIGFFRTQSGKLAGHFYWDDQGCKFLIPENGDLFLIPRNEDIPFPQGGWDITFNLRRQCLKLANDGRAVHLIFD